MAKHTDDILETFHDIEQSQLWTDEVPLRSSDYEALLTEEDTEALMAMLTQADNEVSRKITLADLVALPFKDARESITTFTLAKRLEILEALEFRKAHLYSSAARYGTGSPRDPDYLTTNNWYVIMSSIKRLETLAAWLYGVY